MQIDRAFDESQKEYPSNRFKTNYFDLKEDGVYQIRIISGFALIGNHWIDKKPTTCFGMHRGCRICVEVEKDIVAISGRQDLAEDEKKKLIFKLPSVNVQFVCNVIDRKDGEVKLAKLPYSVAKKISEWKKDPEYPFNDDGSPKFDIKITKETKNKKTTYAVDVVISSVGKELTIDEVERITKVNNNPERFAAAMKKKAAQEAGIDVEGMSFENKDTELPVIQVEPPDEVNVDNIPF